MDLKEWREQLGEWATLPSGLRVRYRKSVTLLDLAMKVDGDLPAPLAGVVNQLIEGKDLDVSIEDFAKMAPLINGMAKMALIEPPVADEADDEHLGVTELPATDRLFLFNLLNEAKRFEKFRSEPDEFADVAQPGDGVRTEAERDNGAGSGVVDGVPGGRGSADAGAVGGETVNGKGQADSGADTIVFGA